MKLSKLITMIMRKTFPEVRWSVAGMTAALVELECLDPDDGQKKNRNRVRSSMRKLASHGVIEKIETLYRWNRPTLGQLQGAKVQGANSIQDHGYYWNDEDGNFPDEEENR